MRKPSAMKRSFFSVEWRSFFLLVRMLLSDTLSIDLKNGKKKAVMRLLTFLLGFAAVAVLSFLFFYLCRVFSIFSILPYIPSSVPSILIWILVLFSFLSTLQKVTDSLYFSPDNSVLLTLPSNGNTLFLARLTVNYLSSYLHSLLLEIPILIGYFALSQYPVYMYFLIFPVWALFDLALLLLSGVLSVPLYYAKRFFRGHNAVYLGLVALLIAAALSAIGYLVSLIPDKIDIFSNWGPYFARIQEGLLFYTGKMTPLYYFSMMFLGGYNGFRFVYFSGFGIAGLYCFLGTLVSVPVLYFLCLFLANPLYLKLASGSSSLQRGSKKNHDKASRPLPPLLSQFRKEALLFFKDSKIAPSFFLIFIGLPILVALTNKLFGAMDINVRGEMMIQIVNLLTLLLVSLSANALVAKLYSQEGGALKIAHTYPLSHRAILLSKILIPSLLGVSSIVASTIVISSIRPAGGEATILSGVGCVFVYLAHLLYSASLDFSSPRSAFAEGSFLGRSENRSTIAAFLLSALLCLLFYCFLTDPIVWVYNASATAGFKILLLGLLLFALCLRIFLRKARYIYGEGDSL